MSEGRRVPKIRFPEFEGEWEEHRISELIEANNEKVTSDCDLPVLTSSKTDGIQYQSEHFGREQNHDVDGYNVLPRGFCTYRNRSDGTDFTFNINNLCDKGIISKFYPVFNTKDGNDLVFLVLLLNNEPKTIQTIAYTAKGTGQKVLSFSDLLKIYVTIPNTQEQHRIGTWFDMIEENVVRVQYEFDKWKELKKSLLQKMFPKEGESVPEIRFPGFTEPWEQRKLEEVVGVYDGTHQTPNYQDHGVMFVSVEDIQTLTSKKYISEEDYKKNFSVVPEQGDILMTRIGDIGTANIVKSAEPLAYYVSLALLKSKGVNAEFMKANISAPAFQNELWLRTLHTAYPKKINKDEISKCMIYIAPSKEEQEQIGSCFNNLDTLIALHQRERDKWKELKNSLLQQMFIA